MLQRTLQRNLMVSAVPAASSQYRQKHTLPSLPYDYADLEPSISARIMEIHHKRHHQTYVDNLNKALNEDASSPTVIQAVRFNGGGHANHSLFWKNLAPSNRDGGVLPSGEAFAKQVEKDFGSFEKLISTFNSQAATLQGSGWHWIGYDPLRDTLFLKSTPNQDRLQEHAQGSVPLLGIDMWEHAYYLDYENKRPEYLKNIWKVVNWKHVSQRFDEELSKKF